MEFKFAPDKNLILIDFTTVPKDGLSSKKEARMLLTENIEKMMELQAKLYAHNRFSILLIFQAMDTAGKDGAIKHVMSGLNPQGTQVRSFKVPTAEELNHDYLWKENKLKSLNIAFPIMDPEKIAELEQCRIQLINE